MDVLSYALSLMLSCGMYDAAGQWLVNVGMPAKSGVGGGVLSCSGNESIPLGFGTYSPLLDSEGNSLKGIMAANQISKELNLHVIRANLAHTQQTHLNDRAPS